MPTVANDPIRVKITWPQLMSYFKTKRFVKKGINLNWERDPKNPGYWFFQASGITEHPNDPRQEIQKEDIEKQIELISKYIVQDRIRDFYAHRIINKDPSIEVMQRITKKYQVENRYDQLIDRAPVVNLINGQDFAIIHGSHVKTEPDPVRPWAYLERR